MNTIVLMGRLARDPETKLASTQKGQTKASRFPLVVKRNRTTAATIPVSISHQLKLGCNPVRILSACSIAYNSLFPISSPGLFL